VEGAEKLSDSHGLGQCLRAEVVSNVLDSRPFGADSSPFVHAVAKPTLEDFEDAIVRAMLEGRGEVAEELARALKARREAAAGNVARTRLGPGSQQPTR
jgi:hypothetical protein